MALEVTENRTKHPKRGAFYFAQREMFRMSEWQIGHIEKLIRQLVDDKRVSELVARLAPKDDKVSVSFNYDNTPNYKPDGRGGYISEGG